MLMTSGVSSCPSRTQVEKLHGGRIRATLAGVISVRPLYRVSAKSLPGIVHWPSSRGGAAASPTRRAATSNRKVTRAGRMCLQTYGGAGEARPRGERRRDVERALRHERCRFEPSTIAQVVAGAIHPRGPQVGHVAARDLGERGEARAARIAAVGAPVAGALGARARGGGEAEACQKEFHSSGISTRSSAGAARTCACRSINRAQVFHLTIASSSPAGRTRSACSYHAIASRSHS